MYTAQIKKKSNSHENLICELLLTAEIIHNKYNVCSTQPPVICLIVCLFYFIIHFNSNLLSQHPKDSFASVLKKNH